MRSYIKRRLMCAAHLRRDAMTEPQHFRACRMIELAEAIEWRVGGDRGTSRRCIRAAAQYRRWELIALPAESQTRQAVAA